MLAGQREYVWSLPALEGIHTRRIGAVFGTESLEGFGVLV